LLPMFGGLLNPHAGLLEHLRRNYRRDWDGIVDGRENIFRRELRQLLPEPRYMVLGTGLRLRRKDGSTLTDADAVVLDRETGDVVFVQLKWYDVYGFNLAERNSRRDNLLTKGNEWVAKVHAWIDGRTSAEIAKAYGWGEAGDAAPRILVMAIRADCLCRALLSVNGGRQDGEGGSGKQCEQCVLEYATHLRPFL